MTPHFRSRESHGQRYLLSGAGLLLLFPVTASAHLVTTGLGPVYDGASHFLLSPETILAIVAVALLGALNGTPSARAAVLGGMAGWVTGSILGDATRHSFNLMICTEASLILGLGVALNWKLSPAVTRIVAFVAGGVLGSASGAALTEGGQGIRGMLGTLVPCFFLLSVVAAIGVGARKEWSRTVVRVAGSWITAMSLLMIGWLWKTGG